MKRADPVKVRVLFAGGGDPKELAISAKKQRWATLRKSLEQLPGWIRLECLRKDGGIVAIVDNPGADAADLEDLTDERVDDDLYRAVGNQSRLILNAIDRVLHRTNSHQENLLQEMTRLLRVLSDRMVDLERMQASYLERMAADAFAGENAELMSNALMEKLTPMILGKLMERAPAKNPNGARPGPGRPKR